jgi:hypothetical protein
MEIPERSSPSVNLRFTITSAIHLCVLCRRGWSTSRSFVPVQVEDSRHKRSAPKIAFGAEVSGWQRITSEIITMSEALALGDMAVETRVAFPFVGHGNICKPQKTIMTP